MGPTDLALWKGIRVKCGEEEYYDDELKEITDAFVCGQYQANKGEFHLISKLIDYM
jgi:hypothetical protein